MCFYHKLRSALVSEQRQRPLVSSLENRVYISAGKSAAVYWINDERVVKLYHDRNSEEADIERRVYERLGSHPHITKYLGSREDGSIVLERGIPLRTEYQSTGYGQIPLHRKLRWLRHAAKGIRHMHGQEIIWADVGSHNMILTRGDQLKILDFEGASIDGGEAMSQYEWFSYRPSIPKFSKQTDIFAFGCFVYEIITGKIPHHELETSDNPSRLSEQLYQEDQFPDVAHLPLGDLIQSCWHATFNSMDEVVGVLEMATSSRSKAKIGAVIRRFLQNCSCFN